MFTPPPSPQPIVTQMDPASTLTISNDAALSVSPSPRSLNQEEKKRSGRRMRRIALLIPFLVVLFTVCTRYISHPAAFDMFSESTIPTWDHIVARTSDWTVHKRHPEPDPQQASSASISLASPTKSLDVAGGTSTPSATQTATGVQSIPTIPGSPPVLPTPFPRPFETLSQNFSSVSCYNFFLNMTNTPAFLTCRPFSLLQQSSGTFINAQQNLSLLNTIIWGTCNTTPGKDTCIANMDWFASALQSACTKDLQDQNNMAVTTLTGLQAYQTMYDASCLSDPTTNTYCYVDAVQNTNPSDLYYYSLPLGITLPKTAIPTCSTCTKSVLTAYSNALKNSTEAPNLTALKPAYIDAAQRSAAVCGNTYATTSVSAALPRLNSQRAGMLSVLAVLLTWAAFEYLF